MATFTITVAEGDVNQVVKFLLDTAQQLLEVDADSDKGFSEETITRALEQCISTTTGLDAVTWSCTRELNHSGPHWHANTAGQIFRDWN